ncbi:histidine kinase [Cytophagales bacterium LB-30]|uniref:Histidine kinase n=1 Tax=Shiella aurantiaca TaxID=3058365 RepID=A0ABT8F4Y9_9BACT|nr:histidine kinase [Shiella aurantiaca]MDN4165511.1 histidine kinase [Shiella aurantiaca]
MKINWKEFGRITLLIIPLSGLMSVGMCTSCWSDPYKTVLIWGYSFALWFFLWIGNGLLTDYLNYKVSWIHSPLKRLIYGLISTVLYTSVIVLIILYFFHQFGLRMSYDMMVWNMYISLGITFVISIVLHARAFLISWRETAIQAEKLQKETVVSQYETLKQQVNPHFLFNSLNSLTQLVYEDQDQAARFIKKLSEVYRYVLEQKDKELVSLEEEIHFTQNYLFLEKSRFGEKLRIQFDIKPLSGYVPPLALQMVVENAIKHNVISTDDPLLVEVSRQDDYLVVKNNLQKKNIVKGSSGIGLQNIRMRYQYLSKAPFRVEPTSTEFIVYLPIVSHASSTH